MKMSADRSGWPTRDSALLIAAASPAFRTGIDPIRVLVSGATTSEIPSPKPRIAGSTSIRKSAGGSRLPEPSRRRIHGALLDGIRANQASPAAMISGPATRNGRAPIRPATVPTGADRTVSMIAMGKLASPAATTE